MGIIEEACADSLATASPPPPPSAPLLVPTRVPSICHSPWGLPEIPGADVSYGDGFWISLHPPLLPLNYGGREKERRTIERARRKQTSSVYSWPGEPRRMPEIGVR